MNKRQMRNSIVVFVVVAAASAGIWAYNWIGGGHRYWVSGAAFNADGTLLATAGGDDHVAEIILWDVAKHRKVARRTLKVGRPRWISFTGRHRQVVLSCDVVGKSWNDYKPNEIIVMDLDRRANVDSFTEPDLVGGTLALEQAQKLVVYGRQSIELREISDEVNQVVMSDREAGLNGIAVSPDELQLAAACDGVARVWNLKSLEEFPALDAAGVDLGKIAVAAGGNFVAATRYEFSPNAETFPLFLWDRTQGASPVKEIQFEQPVSVLRFLPGAMPRLLVVSGKDHLDCRVAIYDLTGQMLGELYAGKAAVEAVDVSPDGTRLVWVDSRGNGELWELAGPQPVRLWKETLGELRFIRFSPDTRLLVGHPWGPDVSLLDAATGKVAQRLQGYQSSNFSLQLLYVLPIMLLIFGINWYTKRQTKRRESVMLAVSKQLGWQLTSGALPDGIPEFHFFAKRAGGRFEHVLLGAGENYDTLVAVYRWMQGSGDKRSPMHQLCVIYPHVSNALPEVFVRPESFTDKLAEYIGFADVDLDSSEPLKRFSDRYLLRTKAPDQMSALINESLADFLCEHEGWNIEIVDGSVLLWWQVVKSFSMSRDPLSEPDRVLEFVEEARTILELLVPDIAGRNRY